MTAPEVIQRIWMPPLWEVGDGIIPVDAQSEDDDVSYILATPEALAASTEVQALIAEAVAKERDRCEDAAIQSSIWAENGKRTSGEWARGVRDARRDIAAAIRDGHKPGVE